jgi:hypothetical protein
MVLTLAVMKGGLVIEWGCAAVPAGVPTAAMAPTARSQEAAAAWIVAMVVAKATGATPTATEATVTVSRPGAGGVAMSMQIRSK